MARTRITHEVDDAIIDDNTKERPEIAPFAKTLNRLLAEKNVHQDDLAQALGISTGSVSNYRRGEKAPGFTMIVKMADYLGVDCHYLMTSVRAKNYVSVKDLGLSDQAINRVLFETTPIPGTLVSENEMNLTSVLNLLLTSTEFWRIVRLLGGYISVPEQKVSRGAKIAGEHNLINYGVVSNDAETIKDILGYRLQKAFHALLNEIDVNESEAGKNGKH